MIGPSLTQTTIFTKTIVEDLVVILLGSYIHELFIYNSKLLVRCWASVILEG